MSEPQNYTNNATTASKPAFHCEDLSRAIGVMTAMSEERKRRNDKMREEMALAFLQAGFRIVPCLLLRDDEIVVSEATYQAAKRAVEEFNKSTQKPKTEESSQ